MADPGVSAGSNMTGKLEGRGVSSELPVFPADRAKNPAVGRAAGPPDGPWQVFTRISEAPREMPHDGGPEHKDLSHTGPFRHN